MFITIDRNSSVSIKKQLYNGLTGMILEGTLSFMDKMPSTRRMAEELSIARNSVIEIYEQLTAEGYLFSEKGKGTFVTKLASVDELCARPETKEYVGERLSEEEDDSDRICFYPGTPDLEHFPAKHWMTYLKDYMYGPNKKILGFSEQNGYRPLRTALVTYLKKHKGIVCCEENIFITNGTSGALNQIALTLRVRYKTLLSEELAIDIVPNIFWCYGFKVEGTSVDHKGINVDRMPEREAPQLIYTSPSHQMPLGGVLPIDRRCDLVEYARHGGHMIIEDDYDSEFRFVGAPVNALKQIDPDSVIYLGTFSKTLGPGLRVGYMVVPDHMVDTFNHTYRKSYAHVQVMDQYCLYRLLDEGQYEKHIYKMTKIYKKKSELLAAKIQSCLGDSVEVIGGESGLHISLRFRDRKFDVSDKSIFHDVGLEVDFVTDYLFEDKGIIETDTVIIGFGHLSLKEIEEGVKRLENLASP